MYFCTDISLNQFINYFSFKRINQPQFGVFYNSVHVLKAQQCLFVGLVAGNKGRTNVWRQEVETDRQLSGHSSVQSSMECSPRKVMFMVV